MLFRSLGPKLGLIDRPGERRIHTTPVPQAGGLAVWGTFMTIGLLVILLTNMSGALNGNWYRAFAVASALLVLLGLADDRWGLSPWVKLGVQVVVAAVLFFSKGRGIGNFLGFEVHWSIDLLIWVVWTVGIINAFNLIEDRKSTRLNSSHVVISYAVFCLKKKKQNKTKNKKT